MTRTEITKLVIETFNQVLKDNDKAVMDEAGENTAIMGANSPFDSIDLVTFIVSLEQTLEDEWSVLITLADDRAMSQTNSPFKSIGSIIDYIEVLANE